MRKELIVPSTSSASTLSVARATRARQGDARRFRERHEPPRHAMAGLPRLAYLLHDGRTRIVCNKKFQVFVAVKPNRLEKTRGGNNNFAEPIMVPLRKLLCVYYLL